MMTWTLIYNKNNFYKLNKKICDLLAAIKFNLNKRYAVKIGDNFLSIAYNKKNIKVNFENDLINIDNYIFDDPEDVVDYIKEFYDETD